MTGRIAPCAADVDGQARFPTEGYRTLVEAQLHAVAVPGAYGRVGADVLTGAVVAEQIARTCVTRTAAGLSETGHC
ncbi:Acyl-CoA dehydrogenase, N-terminal domain [Prauserella aidingensis]|nr:Acyl-CoA dehydrogenase, N-terminal domain [Prauserella aidingensis]